ncbi:MAG: tetratricopeptide repeat protein [Syntrophobacteraceae bacterium]|nr:tetratricopeptide repeat protein [Syntrophobacteraceae bacterium]
MSLQKTLPLDPLSETRDRLEEAGRICRSVLDKTPDDLTYLHLMGIIECKLNRFAQARTWFRKSLALNPDSPEILCSYALCLITGKDFEGAIPLLARAVRIKPDFTLALQHLGDSYKENGNLAEAYRIYERLLALKPDDRQILYDLALIAKELGNLPAALAYSKRAVDREPSNPFCINNLGIICYMLGDYGKALACYRLALELHPDYPEALSNLSILLNEMGAFEQALALSRRALELRPPYPEALNNLALSLMGAGRLKEAIEALRSAAKIKETDPETQYNLSVALLAAEEFEEGWRLFEARWKTGPLKDSHRKYPRPLWRGEPAKDRILFIHPEQGLGDTIQFCRYATVAASLGLRVVMQVQPPLVRLLQSLDGVEVTDCREPAEFDFHCPMMSLPLAMQTGLKTIPERRPYLTADELEIVEWRERIAPLSTAKPRVGLVWAGSARLHSPSLGLTDRRRSIAPEMLAPLVTDNKDIHFFSLQKDGLKAPQALGLIDLMDECIDFADTAALIANLDLVITVDTAVAHLAGALGAPVWVMNRFDSCWRWQRQRETTPWYPSMRLFHQPKAGDWESVIARIASELSTRYPLTTNQRDGSQSGH